MPNNEPVAWWRKGTIYQIYPRSFCDSSNRGWGDIQGIRRHLPHIASLGIDAIWISPFFKSPMKDFGYDVENHRQVDPMFGTTEEFEQLIADAQKLNIKIMVDLVLSHVSDAHPWFKEACKGRDNEYSDCFIWADPKPDGTPPNNWLSIFGGSAWTWNTTRKQYYLHNFLKSQPDLNFHNPRVREEALSIARYWLERGVTGFRLDTANFYFHDQQLRDNPPTTAGAGFMAQETNPYNYQEHVYDKNQPETLLFLSELGALTKQFPQAVTLGEIGAVAHRAWGLINEYTQENRLSLCYTFDLLGERFSAAYLRMVIQRTIKEAPDTWPCWAFSNHDVPRSASRLASNGASTDKIARLSTAILLSLRGTPCLYQGEELGLTEVQVPYEKLQDPYGITFWPDYKGRDGCRTPMPWNHAESMCGFTQAQDTWLPIPPEHVEQAASKQENDPTSVLNYCRRMFALRRQEDCLSSGDFSMLTGTDAILAYQRGANGATIRCYFNLSAEPVALQDSTLGRAQMFDGSTKEWQPSPTSLILQPWTWVWLKQSQLGAVKQTV